MVEYQNIFTQVQVQGPPEMGAVEDVDLRNAAIVQRFRNFLDGSVTRS